MSQKSKIVSFFVLWSIPFSPDGGGQLLYSSLQISWFDARNIQKYILFFQWRWIQIVGKKAATRLKNSSKSSSRIGGAPTSPSFTLTLCELVIVLALLCPSVQPIAFGVSRRRTCLFNEYITIQLFPVVSVSAPTILIRPSARHLFAFLPTGATVNVSRPPLISKRNPWKKPFSHSRNMKWRHDLLKFVVQRRNDRCKLDGMYESKLLNNAFFNQPGVLKEDSATCSKDGKKCNYLPYLDTCNGEIKMDGRCSGFLPYRSGPCSAALGSRRVS